MTTYILVKTKIPALVDNNIFSKLNTNTTKFNMCEFIFYHRYYFIIIFIILLLLIINYKYKKKKLYRMHSIKYK